MRVHIEESVITDEKPLVMVHGAGGSSATWFFQSKGLSSDFHTIAIDLNGHGRSKDFSEEDTLESYVKDVISVLSEFKDPFLMGHSMGGAVSQIVALQNPEMIKGLILVGTGARLKVHPMIFDMLANDFDAYVQSVAEFMFDESTPDEIKVASQAEVRKCPVHIIERDFQACNSFDIMGQVANINIPSLIIVGENDKMTPPKYAQYLHQHISGSTLEIIPDAGHAVMLEQAETFNRLVREWMLAQG